MATTAESIASVAAAVGSIGHREIGQRVTHSTGAVWVYFDHARFTFFPDGTWGSVRYGKQRNAWGMVVSDVRRPT